MLNFPGNLKDTDEGAKVMQDILIEVIPHFMALDWKLWEDDTPEDVDSVSCIASNLDKKYLCIIQKTLNMGSGVYTYKEMGFWDGIGFMRYEDIQEDKSKMKYIDDVKYFARFC